MPMMQLEARLTAAAEGLTLAGSDDRASGYIDSRRTAKQFKTDAYWSTEDIYYKQKFGVSDAQPQLHAAAASSTLSTAAETTHHAAHALVAEALKVATLLRAQHRHGHQPAPLPLTMWRKLMHDNEAARCTAYFWHARKEFGSQWKQMVQNDPYIGRLAPNRSADWLLKRASALGYIPNQDLTYDAELWLHDGLSARWLPTGHFDPETRLLAEFRARIDGGASASHAEGSDLGANGPSRLEVARVRAEFEARLAVANEQEAARVSQARLAADKAADEEAARVVLSQLASARFRWQSGSAEKAAAVEKAAVVEHTVMSEEQPPAMPAGVVFEFKLKEPPMVALGAKRKLKELALLELLQSTAGSQLKLLPGTRIRVYWKGNKKWFSGTVNEYDADENTWLVKYDGEEKHEPLNDPDLPWELLCERLPQPRRREKSARCHNGSMSVGEWIHAKAGSTSSPPDLEGTKKKKRRRKTLTGRTGSRGRDESKLR